MLLDVEGHHILCTNTLPADMIHNLTPSDITLVENQLVDIRPLKPIKLSKVMAVSRSQSFIEDKLLGKIPVADNIPVYRMQDNTPTYIGDMAVMVGPTGSTLYQDDHGTVRAVIARDPLVPEDGIRVLIRSMDNKAIKHSQLTITCNSGFTAENLIGNSSFSFLRERL